MLISEILDDVLLEAGFIPKTSYYSSTDTEAKQLARFANRELYSLAKYPWNALTKTQTVTMTAANEYALPDDFRQYVYDTGFSNLHKAWFPVPKELWSFREAASLGAGLNPEIRIIDGSLYVRNPDSGGTLRLEYVSDKPVLDTYGAAKEKFTADDDTFLLPDDLMTMGVLWRFKKAKGLDFQGELAEYQSMVRREKATDQNAATLNFAECPEYEPNAPFADLYV